MYVEQVLEQPIEVSTHDLSDQSDSDSEPEGSPAVAAAVSNAEREDTLNETAEPQFARELLVFYLFGKILPRHGMFRYLHAVSYIDLDLPTMHGVHIII